MHFITAYLYIHMHVKLKWWHMYIYVVTYKQENFKTIVKNTVSNMTILSITNFLYGLQAAINLTSSLIFLPLSRLSHIISFISPIFSVVLASSKKSIVYRLELSLLFFIAFSSVCLTALLMSSSVVPPWTYVVFK